MLTATPYANTIAIRDVKALLAGKVPFCVTYERCGQNGDGRPMFLAVFQVGERKSVLRRAHQRESGDGLRAFCIWPGLVNFHNEFGDGKPVTLDIMISQ